MIEDRRYRENYLQAERTAEQRRKDLVVAFDEIFDLKCKYRAIVNWVKTLSGALIVAGAVIAWLANHLYDCVAKAAIR